MSMARYEEETDRFVIVTDDGEEIIVIEYTEYEKHVVMGKEETVTKLASYLVTDGGEKVKHLGNNRYYQVLDTAVIGTRHYDQGD